MKYNPDIHHRQSIRLREYDYSTVGAYFVTICIHGRECLFGEVADGAIQLNPAGEIVRAAWDELLERFPDVTIDVFVIMPNHFHGIIMLNDCMGEPCVRPNDCDFRRGESCIRPPLKDQGEQNQGEHKVRPYGTAAGSVGRIVQVFKSMTTNAYIRGVKEQGWPPFPGRLWQRNYYERVIRDERELAGIREYILYNPMKWAEDEENPANAHTAGLESS